LKSEESTVSIITPFQERNDDAVNAEYTQSKYAIVEYEKYGITADLHQVNFSYRRATSMRILMQDYINSIKC
jgi:hypothetical protein